MKHFFILLLLTLLSSRLYSQVGIRTNNPATTLDIHAVNHNGALTAEDGVLIPRVNLLSANGDVEGLLIYLMVDDPANGFSQGFHFWEDGVWNPISSGSGGGGGQIFSSSWFIGNVTSSNSIVSDVTGRISSVVLNPALSTGTAATYDVVLDDNYLAGDLGVDFHIVSELTTRSLDGTIRRDTRTHRAVQRLSSNSFRIVMYNLESSSARQIGVTISILRTSQENNLVQRGTERGLFNTFTDLTTMINTPVKDDQATIATYDSGLLHINGSAVPTNEDRYELYYDGSNWVYIGWSSFELNGPDWIVDPSGFVLGSTAAVSPSKATSPDVDLVRYRELGNNYVEVEMRYAAASSAGGTAGSSGGEYLFTLPNGYAFDTTEHPLFTGSGVVSNSIAPSFSLPIKQSSVSESGQSGSNILPIPYNTTQFRGLTFSGSAVNDYIGWRHFQFDIANSTYLMRFTFKRL